MSTTTNLGLTKSNPHSPDYTTSGGWPQALDDNLDLIDAAVGAIQGGSFSFASVPASASAAGVAGAMAYDSNYIYICVSTNTWKRVAIATW